MSCSQVISISNIAKYRIFMAPCNIVNAKNYFFQLKLDLVGLDGAKIVLPIG